MIAMIAGEVDGGYVEVSAGGCMAGNNTVSENMRAECDTQVAMAAAVVD